jgi:hypothetical protein
MKQTVQPPKNVVPLQEKNVNMNLHNHANNICIGWWYMLSVSNWICPESVYKWETSLILQTDFVRLN